METNSNFKKGFTLLELMITVVVLAILATLVFVNMNGFLQRKKIESAAYKLQTFLTKAKTIAYKKEATCFIKFVPSTAPRTVLVYRDVNNNNTLDVSTDIVEDSLNILSEDDIHLGVYLMLSSDITSNGNIITINKKTMAFELKSASSTIEIRKDGVPYYYKIELKNNEPRIYFYRVEDGKEIKL